MSTTHVPHGTHVSASAKSVAARLIHEYNLSPILTGESEAYRNFRQTLIRESARLTPGQAEAAKMRIDVVDVQVDGRTVLTQSMWNTAPPMHRETIKNYFETIGESEGEDTSWAPDNQTGSYGQGLRQGMLPKNLYGFVIIGVPQDGSAPFMLWIEYLKDEKVFALKPLLSHVEVDEDFGDETPVYAEVVDVANYEGIDFTAFLNDDLRKWGGMAFVSLGNERGDHTAIKPASLGGPTGAVVEKVLTARIHDAQAFSFVEVWTWDKSGNAPRAKRTWELPEGDYSCDDRTRAIKPHSMWFDPASHPEVQSATLVHPDGTHIRIGLAPEPSTVKSPSHFPFAAKGYAEVVYKSDVHPLWKSREHPETCAFFGINDKKVAQRIALEITPPKVVTGAEPFGISQDRTRTFLYAHSHGKDAMHLADSGKPAEWGAWVADNLPDFVKDALNKARSERAADVSTDWKKVLQDVVATVRARHAGSMATARNGGPLKGDPTGEETLRKAETGKPVEDEGGSQKGKKNEDDEPGDYPGGGGGSRTTTCPVPTVDLTQPGEAGASDARHKAAVEVLVVNPGGAIDAAPKRTSSLPDPIWHSHADFYAAVAALNDPEEDPKATDYPAYFNPTLPGSLGKEVHFNWDHAQFRDLREFYLTTWAKKNAKPWLLATDLSDMVEDAMKIAYIEVVIGCVISTQRAVRNKDEQAKLFGPDHLATIIRGDFNVKYRIDSLLGTYADLARRGKYVAGGKPAAAA